LGIFVGGVVLGTGSIVYLDHELKKRAFVERVMQGAGGCLYKSTIMKIMTQYEDERDE
jgi:hypothetical protein